jgi:hypothetical protein
MQSIPIAREIRELLDIGLLDSPCVAVPTIPNLQILETQACCVGDHGINLSNCLAVNDGWTSHVSIPTNDIRFGLL